MKYRLLSSEELNHFKKEFVSFLIINGIDAKQWEFIKIEETEKADQLLEDFSDVIFEKVLRDIKFLDFRSENILRSFQCLSDKMVLVSMETDDKSLNLLDVNALNLFLQKPSGTFQALTSEKKYQEQREVELFKMINSGCEIANGKLFKVLCLALA